MTPKLAQLQVPANKLVAGAPYRLDLPFEADWVMMPILPVVPYAKGGYTFVSNNGDADQEYALHMNDVSALPILFSTAESTEGGTFCVFVGKVKTIFVEPLYNVDAPINAIYLMVGKDCNLGTLQAVFGPGSGI